MAIGGQYRDVYNFNISVLKENVIFFNEISHMWRLNFSEGNHLQHEEALEFVFSFSMRPRVTILNNNTEKKRRDLAQKKKTE